MPNIHMDYMFTKYEDLEHVIECKTLSMNNVIDEIRSTYPDFNPATLSDHSIILVTCREDEDFEIGSVLNTSSSAAAKETVGHPKPVRYKMTGIKPDFLNNNENAQILIEMIDELTELRLTQDSLDTWYKQFVTTYHNEMDQFYKRLEDTPSSKKNYYIARKAWWSEELGALAKKTLAAERNFLKLQKERKDSKAAKQKFLNAQKDFDKLVKKTKRKWQRNKVFELEQANLNDPRAFWAHIKGLRKNKHSTIPMETYMEDEYGNKVITTDIHQVYDRWARDFGSLLTPPEKPVEAQEFVESIKRATADLEQKAEKSPQISLIEILQ